MNEDVKLAAMKALTRWLDNSESTLSQNTVKFLQTALKADKENVRLSAMEAISRSINHFVPTSSTTTTTTTSTSIPKDKTEALTTIAPILISIVNSSKSVDSVFAFHLLLSFALIQPSIRKQLTDQNVWKLIKSDSFLFKSGIPQKFNDTEQIEFFATLLLVVTTFEAELEKSGSVK
jgi:hypothetical protein